MKIVSVRAAALTDPTVLGRAVAEPAAWHAEIDHMNPLGFDSRYAGQAGRFEPRWGETVCVVTTEDGSWGVGMTGLAGVTVPLINEYLAPMLLGDEAFEIERLWQMMVTSCGSHFGASGPAAYAISAVDLALWDLKGKNLDRPVWALVGGSADREPLQCYATGMDVDAYADLGFAAFKLPCPWRADNDAAVAATVELVASTRAHVGTDVPLMLDGWAIHDVDSAVAVGHALASYDLTWFEDYIFPANMRGYAEVRERLPGLMLAAGERWSLTRPFADVIDGGWVDIVQPDALWVGGATPTIAVAQQAADHDVGLAIHCGANDSYGQHLAYGLSNNTWAEMYIGSAPGSSLSHCYRSTPGMALPSGGQLRASESPGFGIELTLTDIERATR